MSMGLGQVYKDKVAFLLRGLSGTVYEMSNDIRQVTRAREDTLVHIGVDKARILARVGQTYLPLTEEEIKLYASYIARRGYIVSLESAREESLASSSTAQHSGDEADRPGTPQAAIRTEPPGSATLTASDHDAFAEYVGRRCLGAPQGGLRNGK